MCGTEPRRAYPLIGAAIYNIIEALAHSGATLKGFMLQPNSVYYTLETAFMEGRGTSFK